MPEALEATLRRLQEERAEADRRYNQALTALDGSLRPPPEFPGALPAYDEHQITPLNDAWNIVPAAPGAAGLAGRLAGFIWRTVGPYLQRQLTFNSRLVDHINRNAAGHRESQRALETLVTVLREQSARQAEIHSRLLYLLQQITPYVDTRDRDTAGGALVLNAALSAMAEDLGKRWESMAAREHRHETRLSELAKAHDEELRDIRAAVSVAQQAALAVKRELERGGVTPAAMALATAPPDEATGDRAFTGRLDAYKYVGFEDQFRGSSDEIRARLETYLPLFEDQRDVLDVGCGRGEFLDLLAARGIVARGIDVNPEMVEVCRARGLEAAQADGVGYLDGLPDAALGGVFAAQVVEHLEPAYLLRLLELSSHKLRPGGTLVLETLNPACWVAFFESYIRDITHVRPLHPETLKYLVTASGFAAVRIEYRSPVPPEDKLQRLPVPVHPDPVVTDLIELCNANSEKLNARMFTHLDYAVVATR